MSRAVAEAESPSTDVHPFDLGKSDFEILLEKEFKPMETAMEEAEYAEHQTHLNKMAWRTRIITRLQEALNDDYIKFWIMPLMNSRLGFLTDRDPAKMRDNDRKPPYSIAEVRNVVVEACLRGAMMTDNETNIIAGNWYGTKNYFWRKLCEFPGISDLTPIAGVPKFEYEDTQWGPKPKRAVVPYKVTYAIKGQKYEISRDIAVKLNSQSTDDVAVGKADRKMWATVWAILSGTPQELVDPEDYAAALADKNGDKAIPKTNAKDSVKAAMEAEGTVAETKTAGTLQSAPAPSTGAAPQTPANPAGGGETAAKPSPAAPVSGRPRAKAAKAETPASDSAPGQGTAPVDAGGQGAAPTGGDPRTPREQAQEFSETLPLNQLKEFLADNEPRIARAKVVAKISGPWEEFDEKATRTLAMFVWLAMLEGK